MRRGGRAAVGALLRAHAGLASPLACCPAAQQPPGARQAAHTLRAGRSGGCWGKVGVPPPCSGAGSSTCPSPRRHGIVPAAVTPGHAAALLHPSRTHFLPYLVNSHMFAALPRTTGSPIAPSRCARRPRCRSAPCLPTLFCLRAARHTTCVHRPARAHSRGAAGAACAVHIALPAAYLRPA